MSQRRYKFTFDRTQKLLLPERAEDHAGENHQVRALDARQCSSFTSTGIRWGIRGSRKLEAETRRNLKVIRLMKGMQPSYKSISNFRKDHVAQLREINRDFVLLCRELCLFGREVAVDGPFLKADSAKASLVAASGTPGAERIADGGKMIPAD